MSQLNTIHINSVHAVKRIHTGLPIALLLGLGLSMVPHVVLHYAMFITILLGIALLIPALRWFMRAKDYEGSLDIMSSAFLSIPQEKYVHIRFIQKQLKLNIMLVLILMSSMSLIYLVRSL